MTNNAWITERQERVNTALERHLPSPALMPHRLHEAMRYAVLNGGKRVRPLLLYAAGESFGAKPEALDDAACAVELIHAYSLAHDDLPAMDNDELRRGKPTCHKAFDEATAILAGDTLQCLAFEILTQNPHYSPPVCVELVKKLAKACGSFGMAGGQSLDLLALNKKPDLEQLKAIHALKTGALFRACIQMGGIIADCTTEELAHIDELAEQLGIAFQIQDDVLDVVSPTEILGKTQGADERLQKPTYPALVGLEKAKELMRSHYQTCLNKISGLLKKDSPLFWVCDYLQTRDF